MAKKDKNSPVEVLKRTMASLPKTTRNAILNLAKNPDAITLARQVARKREARALRWNPQGSTILGDRVLPGSPIVTEFRRERSRGEKVRRDNLFIHSGENFRQVDSLATRVALRSRLEVSVVARMSQQDLKAESMVGEILNPHQVFLSWCRKLEKNPERYTYRVLVGDENASEGVNLDLVTKSFRWIIQIDSDRKGGKVQDLIDVEVRV